MRPGTDAVLVPCYRLQPMGGEPRIVFDSSYLTIYDPWTLPGHFHALEGMIAVGFVLTLRHAIARCREGAAWPLFLWLTTLAYGVWMELLTYHTVDNFSHAQFTVMLYMKKLPLYVVLLYPAFVYTAIQSARRLGMGVVGTFFTAGLLIVMIDVPFDIMGPDCKWWWWNKDAEDPLGLVAHRWLGVPVASYCWHLLFGGSQWLVTYRLRSRVARWTPRSAGATVVRALPLAMVAGLLSVVVGIIVMMPFHLFRGPLGFHDGVFTTILLVVATLAFVTARPRIKSSPEGGCFVGWVILWNFFYLLLGYWMGRDGDMAHAFSKTLVIVGVAVVSVMVHTYIDRLPRAGSRRRLL